MDNTTDNFKTGASDHKTDDGGQNGDNDAKELQQFYDRIITLYRISFPEAP